MDLKEFITETISSIAEATIELQTIYTNKGVLINPPAPQTGNPVYHPDSGNYTYRRVKDIAFDVAVTAGKETSGSGRAGLKVMSIELGGGAEHSIAHESISRVQFTIPITLPPTADEEINKAAKHRESATLTKSIENLGNTLNR